ncbi:hypothetical protein JXB28_06620 [Candidatus Woesearchaeota archaeon]|nr:hypothetical protein [Candidatus Woesearchaeota archaeon]
MRDKKGQLSIETMIIYGLVILVTLSVIGGLLYFKVLDVTAYLPDKCDLGGSGDVKCEEWAYTADGLKLGIRNTGQKPIVSMQAFVTDEVGTNFDGSISSDTNTATIAPGDIGAVEFTDGGGEAGKILRGPLTLKYEFQGGAIEMETTGSIRVKSSGGTAGTS